MKKSTCYCKYIKGEKVRIAFLFQAGTVWPALESVYEACLEDDRIDAKLIFDPHTTVEKAHSAKALDFLKSKGYDYSHIDEINFEEYTPHVVFVQFPYDAAFHIPAFLSLNWIKRGSRVVYVPYGIEIADTSMARKDHFNSRVVENAWRIYTSCDDLKREYDKYCRNRRAVRALGAPKFDSICHSDRYPINPEYLKRANGRKIILWKIHFPKKNIINGQPKMITPALEEYLKFADILDRFRDLFFVLMPHPKLLRGMVASDIHGDQELVNFGERLKEILESKDNVAIDTSDDYRNSLYNADAIIIDRSAVMVETALLNVPVLYMHNADFNEPMTAPVQRIIDTYEQGTQAEDMISFVQRITDGDSFDISKRQRTTQEIFPDLDGCAGVRIKDDIIKSLDNEAAEDSVPEVVLYGTGEVASYYMEQQNWRDTKEFEIVAFADSDPRKRGSSFYGYPVISPDSVTDYEFDYVVVMTEPHFYEIQNDLVNRLFISDKDVLRLDEFVVNILPEV